MKITVVDCSETKWRRDNIYTSTDSFNRQQD